MLKKVEENEKRLIEEYIGDDYNKCLYLYLDFMKFGLTNINIKSWLDVENDEIKAVILKYYSGMHIFSKYGDCDYKLLVNLILQEEPSVICAEKYLIENLSELIDAEKYGVEYGWVRGLNKCYDYDDAGVEVATADDYDVITNLLLNTPIFGAYNTFDELKKQIEEQNETNYGRNYIIKDNDKIISHIATSAESDKIAVPSLLVTHENYRGKGLAIKVFSKICNDVILEGKTVYVTNYSYETTVLCNKMGFEPTCEIGKLYKK